MTKDNRREMNMSQQAEKPPIQITRHRASIINALRQAGGEVEDKSGKAVSLLSARLEGNPPKTLSTILQTMERQGVITREVRGKRTFRIMLVDGVVVEKVIEHMYETPLTLVPVPEIEPDPVPDPVPASVFDYPQLADALLTRVSQLIGQDGKRPKYDDLLTRLHTLTEDRARLTTRAELAEELAAARGKELEGVRGRLRVAEANIAKMLKGGRRGVGEETRKTIERFMQERPHQPQGGDK